MSDDLYEPFDIDEAIASSGGALFADGAGQDELRQLQDMFFNGEIDEGDVRNFIAGKVTISALNRVVDTNQRFVGGGFIKFKSNIRRQFGVGVPFRFSFKNYGGITKPVPFYFTGAKNAAGQVVGRENPKRGMVVLPVPPENFELSNENSVEEVNSINGLTFFHGGPFNPESIKLEGFFPYVNTLRKIPDYIPRDTLVNGLYEPAVLRDKFMTAMRAAQPINFAVSQPQSGHVLVQPMTVIITEFNWSYKSGHGRDIFWNMTLRRWTPQNLYLTGKKPGGGGGKPPKPPKPPVKPGGNRPGGKPTGRRYVIKRGDTLWGIADRSYGDGKLWPVVHKHNIKILNEALRKRGERYPNPNLIYPGTIIYIPKKK